MPFYNFLYIRIDSIQRLVALPSPHDACPGSIFWHQTSWWFQVRLWYFSPFKPASLYKCNHNVNHQQPPANHNNQESHAHFWRWTNAGLFVQTPIACHFSLAPQPQKPVPSTKNDQPTQGFGCPCANFPTSQLRPGACPSWAAGRVWHTSWPSQTGSFATWNGEICWRCSKGMMKDMDRWMSWEKQKTLGGLARRLLTMRMTHEPEYDPLHKHPSFGCEWCSGFEQLGPCRKVPKSKDMTPAWKKHTKTATIYNFVVLSFPWSHKGIQKPWPQLPTSRGRLGFMDPPTVMW